MPDKEEPRARPRSADGRTRRKAELTARNPYELDLEQNAANFVALSPLTYLERSAAIWPRE